MFLMHIGKKHDDYKNIELCIDGWSVKKVESISKGRIDHEDIMLDDIK